MISTTTPLDYKELKAIWLEAFDEVGVNNMDAEYYADTFLLHHDNFSGLTYRENGRIVSMLFLIPCFWDGAAGYYVYACTTQSQFREKGYMKALLDAAFEKAQNENAFGLVLIPGNPSLCDYYGKNGFQPFSHIEEHVFKEKNEHDDCSFVKTYDVGMINDLRNHFYENHFAIQFGQQHIQYIQNRMVNEHGATLYFKDVEKEGYAFCIFDDLNEKVYVWEWAMISNSLQKDIFSFFTGICHYFNVSVLSIRSKSGLGLGCERPFSMIRLCTAKQIPKNPYFNLGMD